MNLDFLSDRARSALTDAISSGECIHELEFVDVPYRTLNSLDDAGIISLKHLVATTIERLLNIEGIGEASIEQIRNGLSQFDFIGPLRAKAEHDLEQRVAKHEEKRQRSFVPDAVEEEEFNDDDEDFDIPRRGT